MYGILGVVRDDFRCYDTLWNPIRKFNLKSNKIKMMMLMVVVTMAVVNTFSSCGFKFIRIEVLIMKDTITDLHYDF
jgi:hypothetical protein